MKKLAKIRRMATGQTLASKRLILLLGQLIAEEGGIEVRGTQAKVARTTGVPAMTIGRLLNGERLGVNLSTIDEVKAKMRLRPEFFHDERLKEPHYKDYIERPGVKMTRAIQDQHVEEPDPAQIENMLDAIGASPEEQDAFRQHLKLFTYRNLSAAHVQTFIAGVRAGKKMRAAIDRAVTASAESEMRASGRRKVPPSSDADKPTSK